ncbi:PREDICTED: poly [ADP-ribose] polymerase 9-like [Nanorana parkeri]|uniref:poly [ADP-ribose] polymerase 9-like n=1 Tax=Nanorana parkeri TaxID=125878 RepID=UPI000854ED7B|nr:PREDICTED: poly [ADP-ribose] polymerase 9-like [Nanorana parkeri]
MEATRRIPLPESTYRHLLGCRDEITDLFLRKFSCDAELRGPKPSGYQAASVKPEIVYKKRTSGGPVVSVWKDDLTRQDADVVVNAANEDLDHAGGLARALVEAGGPIIEKDSKEYIRANGRLKTGEYAVTHAGNLPCKCLLHAVGPVWFDDAAAQCESELAECIRNVLKYVDNHKDIGSVAIPAVSSGIFGFPLQKCAKIMVETIHSFCNRVTQSHVTEIRLVNNIDLTVQAMRSACEDIFGRGDDLSGETSASGNQTWPVTRSMGATPQPSSSASSNMTGHGQPSAHGSSPHMSQSITINGLTLHLTKGLIQEQTTAVIVNSLGPDLNMNGGQTSTAILAKAGYELQMEVNNYRPYYPFPTMFPTMGYRLPCNFVYHVILQSYYQRSLLDAVGQATAQCLNTAHQNNCPSISFPALGTGNFGLSKKDVADVMVDAVMRFAGGHRCSMQVYIVIHPQDTETYKAFQDQCKSQGWPEITESGAEQRDPRPDVHGKSSEFTDSEIPCLIINGTSNEGVEEAEAWMKNVLQTQPVSIQNNLVLLFGKEEHDILSSSDFQDVSIEEKLSNGTSVLKVDGLPQDKVRAVIQVERLLLDVQEKHAVTLEEELLEAAVVWFYRNKSGVRRYPTKANRELEKAFVTQSNLTLTSEPHHVICMKDLTAKGKDGTFQLQRQKRISPCDVSEEHCQTYQRAGSVKTRVHTDSEIPCLIINGTSNEGVEEAEAWMKNVLQTHPVSIQNNLVLLFGKEEHDILSSSDFQDVSIEEKLSNGTSVLKVDGLPQDKVRAVIQVERLLLDVQEKHAVTLEEELLEAAVVWFYRNKSGVRRYPTKANRELEKAFVTQSDLTLTSEPHHVICMKDLTAKGKDGTFQLQRQKRISPCDVSEEHCQTYQRAGSVADRFVDPQYTSSFFLGYRNHICTSPVSWNRSSHEGVLEIRKGSLSITELSSPRTRGSITGSPMNVQKGRRPEDSLSLVVPVDSTSQEFRDHADTFRRERLTLVKMEKIDNGYLSDIFQSKKGVKPSDKRTCLLYQLVPRQFSGLVCDVGFQRIFSNPKDPRFGQGIYFTDTPRRTLDCFQTPEEQGGLLHFFQAEVLSDSSSDGRDAPVLVPKKPSHRSKPDDILDLCESLVNSTLFPSVYVIPDSFRANPRCLFTCRRQGVYSSRI